MHFQLHFHFEIIALLTKMSEGTLLEYRIFANSFRGNYSFLNLTLCTVTFVHSTYSCGNYSREQTIQGRKLFAEIRYPFYRFLYPMICGTISGVECLVVQNLEVSGMHKCFRTQFQTFG